MTLKNALVVILGGSTGIGLATARAAKAEGAQVIVTGRSTEKLQRAQAELGSDARTVVLDVADEEAHGFFFQGLVHVDHVFITAGTLIADKKLAPNSDTLRLQWILGFGARCTPRSMPHPKLPQVDRLRLCLGLRRATA
jgi:NADP-dependent 3-hydroxy acid dehydrogenase YdfG